jgi:NAD(P)H-hydrate epimerase
MDTGFTLAPVARDANKYTRGSLLILAGSRRYVGAGVLATLAAERGGAGYVSLATPASAAAAARAHLVCSPVIEAPEAGKQGTLGSGTFCGKALPAILGELRHINALCCGPGLGLGDETIAFVGELVRFAGEQDIPLLLDADALGALAAAPELLEARLAGYAGTRSTSPLILTPHAGELARLLAAWRIGSGDEDAGGHNPAPAAGLLSRLSRYEKAHATTVMCLARLLGVVLVAKGPVTFITDGERLLKSDEATPALATAGTGDVLAGLTASLLAQGMPVFEAAALGVQIHSCAGVLAERQLGCRSVTALDVVQAIPSVMQAAE